MSRSKESMSSAGHGESSCERRRGQEGASETTVPESGRHHSSTVHGGNGRIRTVCAAERRAPTRMDANTASPCRSNDESCANDELQGLFAGMPVHLRRSETKGRYLVAARDVDEGELLLVDQVYACAVLPSHKKRVCNGCFRAQKKRLDNSCRDCGQVYYCSDACRRRHWEGTGETAKWCVPHSMLCGALKHFASSKCDNEMENVLRMMLEIVARKKLEEEGCDVRGTRNGAVPLTEDNLIAEFQKCRLRTTEEILPDETAEVHHQGTHIRECDEMPTTSATPTDEFVPAVYEFMQALPVLEYSNFCSLQSHAKGFSKLDTQDWNKPLKFLLQSLRRSGWSSDCLPDVSTALELGSRIDSNCFGMYSDRGKREDCYGREVYLRISYVNHSCDPNARMTAGSGVAGVVAERAIRRGEEVNISYFDSNMPVSTRQKYLKKHYRFSCKCARCAAELVARKPAGLTYTKSARTSAPARRAPAPSSHQTSESRLEARIAAARARIVEET